MERRIKEGIQVFDWLKGGEVSFFLGKVESHSRNVDEAAKQAKSKRQRKGKVFGFASPPQDGEQLAKAANRPRCVLSQREKHSFFEMR